jgi:hypothetical protein
MDKKYIVLIADIESSRTVVNRNELQSTLKNCLAELNHTRENLISPYTLTLGDEFQAVFASAGRVFIDAVEILAAIHPQVARFSLGIGTITTAINTHAALEMDGPAFYAARDGMSILKKNRGLFRVSGIDSPSVDMLNASLSLLASEIRKWKPIRLQTMALLNRGLTVKEIARELDMSDKGIYKTIADGNLLLVKQYFRDASAVIDEVLP